MWYLQEYNTSIYEAGNAFVDMVSIISDTINNVFTNGVLSIFVYAILLGLCVSMLVMLAHASKGRMR